MNHQSLESIFARFGFSLSTSLPNYLSLHAQGKDHIILLTITPTDFTIEASGPDGIQVIFGLHRHHERYHQIANFIADSHYLSAQLAHTEGIKDLLHPVVLDGLSTKVSNLLQHYGFTDILLTRNRILSASMGNSHCYMSVVFDLQKLEFDIDIKQGQKSFFFNKIFVGQGFKSIQDLKKILDANQAFTYYRQQSQ